MAFEHETEQEIVPTNEEEDDDDMKKRPIKRTTSDGKKVGRIISIELKNTSIERALAGNSQTTTRRRSENDDNVDESNTVVVSHSIGIQITGFSKKDLKRGNVIGINSSSSSSSSSYTQPPPRCCSSFECILIIHNHISCELVVGDELVVSCHSSCVGCIVSKIKGVGETNRRNPRLMAHRDLRGGNTIVVELQPKKSMCVEKYSEFKTLGTLGVRKGDLGSIAIGQVTNVFYPTKEREEEDPDEELDEETMDNIKK